jgi:hypothetical protein
MERDTHYTPTQWAVRIIGLLILPVALLLGRLFASQVHDAPVICLWRRLFGWRCLGCGMTRALCLFATGQWGASIRTNWLIVPVIAAALVIFIMSLIWLIRACKGRARC